MLITPQSLIAPFANFSPMLISKNINRSWNDDSKRWTEEPDPKERFIFEGAVLQPSPFDDTKMELATLTIKVPKSGIQGDANALLNKPVEFEGIKAWAYADKKGDVKLSYSADSIKTAKGGQ